MSMTKCKFCEDLHSCHTNGDELRVSQLRQLRDEADHMSTHYTMQAGLSGTVRARHEALSDAAFHSGASHAYGRSIELLGGAL
jgi:hypothetical protein